MGRKALVAFYELWKTGSPLRDQITVLELLDEVLEKSGYAAYLRDGSEEGEERWENVLELRAVAAEYDHLPLEEALTALSRRGLAGLRRRQPGRDGRAHAADPALGQGARVWRGIYRRAERRHAATQPVL